MSTQNTFTARKLLNKAFRMVGIKSQGETIEGDEAIEALALLNEILAYHSTSGALVPYLTNITFTTVPGKASYTLGKTEDADVNTRRIMRLDYAQYVIDTTTYKIKILGKSGYYGAYRIDTQSQPYNVLLQNSTYLSTLTFYPVPDKAYQIILNAKQVFDDLEMDDRLDEIPTNLYLLFQYALARELVELYHGLPWTEKQESVYQKMLTDAMASSDIDYSVDDTYSSINPNSGQAVLNGYGL